MKIIISEVEEYLEQGEAGVTCIVCNKTYNWIADARRHVRAVHVESADNSKRSCTLCGKSFKNRWSLATHERNVHKIYKSTNNAIYFNQVI